MNMQRKRWRILLSVTMIICMIAGLCLVSGKIVKADGGVTDDGFQYEINEGSIVISKYTGAASEVTIPEEINDKPVTGIKGSAFFTNSTTTKIEISKNISSIDAYAFIDCYNLVDIEVSADNENYASYDGCLYDKNLTEIKCCPAGRNSVEFPDSIVSIGNCSFARCYNFTTLVLPEGIVTIDEKAFEDCWNLREITIPSSLKQIENSAFAGCRELNGISFPEGILSLGDAAFADSGLVEFNVPSSLSDIGVRAFYNCQNLSTIQVSPDNDVYSLYDGCIYDKAKSEIILCPETKSSVDFPDSLTIIGRDAFGGCSHLTSVSIPNSVTEIKPYAFQNCSELSTVDIPNTVEAIGDGAFAYCNNLSSVEIPSGIATISDYLFTSCMNLESIRIPDEVTSIGKYAFWNCQKLADISIPENVTMIGDEAFFRCHGLKEVVIPDGVTSIGGGAFCNCSNLINVTIPASVTTIEEWTFRLCSDNLTIFGEEESEAERYALENGINFLPLSFAENPFADVPMGKYYTAPVLWAVHSDPQVTTGTSDQTFEPGTLCNRAQAVTFLWRMMGCPEPGTTTNPFRDVSETAYYYKAVLWAVEKNITTGKYPDRFAPKDSCNRAQFVTFLWRAAGSPVPQGENNPFLDVDAGKYYTDAILWASENQITTGTDETHFSPFKNVSRGQAVTFLYRGKDVVQK